MYQWTDVVFSAQSVFDAIPVIAQKDMQSADTNLSRSTENVERHLIPSIEAHPETVFKIYMPPSFRRLLVSDDAGRHFRAAVPFPPPAL